MADGGKSESEVRRPSTLGRYEYPQGGRETYGTVTSLNARHDHWRDRSLHPTIRTMTGGNGGSMEVDLSVCIWDVLGGGV